MTLGDQMRDRQFAADAVVHRHRALAFPRAPVDQHHGDVPAADLVDGGGLAPDRGDENSERALFPQHAEVVMFAGGVVATIAQDDRQARGDGDAFRPGGQVGEERVADVEHDQADGAAAARPQLPGRFVADEAELVYRAQHAIPGGRRHPLGPVQDVGHGAHGDPGPGRDVHDAG